MPADRTNGFSLGDHQEMENAVAFESDGLKLAGYFGYPETSTDARCPAIVIMHGFGGHKDGPQQRWSVKFYQSLGYATLRFDFRGCGESDGRRGWVIPDEEIGDAIAAVRWMAGQARIDPVRIALSGTSYGATVAIGAAAREKGVAAVIAQGGWGNGERMFRLLHSTPEAWQRFSELLEDGRRRKAAGDQSMRVHRYDLIPVPERLRANIDPRSIFDFSIDTGLETFAYNAEEEIASIAPRPVLLIHSARDDVIRAACSADLFAAAGQPTDLHIVSGVDHFMFGEDDQRVANLVGDWLGRYMPA
jgi:pimeloyl-ACP methyl ester carboxylesterase